MQSWFCREPRDEGVAQDAKDPWGIGRTYLCKTQRGEMIVRHFTDPEVARTHYRAHGGADAWMILTSQFMEGIEFLACATLQPGKIIEEHIDPVEEIYHIYRGSGHMKVGDEVREVKEGDSIWIPAGAPHALENRTSEVTMVLVIAAYPR